LSFVSIFVGYYFVQGGFSSYFSLNSASIRYNEILSDYCFKTFWLNPFIDNVFFDYYFNDTVLHQLLPVSIFFVLMCILSLSVFFILFLKTLSNVLRVKFVTATVSTKIFGVFNNVCFRHIFNFFSKAWLFDILLAKTSRILFFLTRVFVLKKLESGLFEFMFVLLPLRSLIIFQQVIRANTLTGKLSTYISIICYGALFFFVFNILCFFLI